MELEEFDFEKVDLEMFVTELLELYQLDSKLKLFARINSSKTDLYKYLRPPSSWMTTSLMITIMPL
jgi:hypothetical protein